MEGSNKRQIPEDHSDAAGKKKQSNDRHRSDHEASTSRRPESALLEKQHRNSDRQKTEREQHRGKSRSGSSKGREMHGSKEKTISQVNTSNRQKSRSSGQGSNPPTRRDSNQNASNPPVPQPSSHGQSSSIVPPPSVVSSAAENQPGTSTQNVPQNPVLAVLPTTEASQPKQTAENVPQSTPVEKNAQNQQVQSSSRPETTSSTSLPSLVENSAMKQPKTTSQKSQSGPPIVEENVEKFIIAVQDYPCLYDPAFEDKKKKEEAWATMSEKFGTTPDVCRRKWQSLLRSNKNYKKKILTDEFVTEKNKEFLNHMRFVPTSRSSAQEEHRSPSEQRLSQDKLLGPMVEAVLLEVPLNQKRSFRSKILGILAEYSK